jgi:hypothetical protein
MKLLKFKAHFNRVNMQRGNPNVWTVHTSRACYQVTEIKSYVPMLTTFKKDGKQPRAYFSGRAEVRVHNGIAYLLNEHSYESMSDDEYFEARNG